MAKDFGELTMELTPDMEKELVEHFNIEVEVLMGQRNILPNGKIEFKLKVYDDQKCGMIKEFCLQMISKSKDKNLN